MDAIMKGSISYGDFERIIINYFKENYGVELNSFSSKGLKDKFGNECFACDQLVFSKNEDFGKVIYDIPEHDIGRIFNLYLATKNYRLVTNLEFGSDVITFNFKNAPELENEVRKKISVDTAYYSEISYEGLRDIIIDYWQKTTGETLLVNSLDYLEDDLREANLYTPKASFIRVCADGKRRLLALGNQTVQEILELYFVERNYELEKITYDNMIKLKLNNINKENTVKIEVINDKKDEDFNYFDDVIELDLKEEKKEDSFSNKEEEHQKEKRKFIILQKEREIDCERRMKNRSLIRSGLSILAAGTTIYFNDQDSEMLLQHELDAIYSWDALWQYFQELGPVTTAFYVCAWTFLARYIKHSRKFYVLRDEYYRLKNSLENDKAKEEKKKNVRTRRNFNFKR